MKLFDRVVIHQHTYWDHLGKFLLEQDTYPHWSVFCIESGELAYEVLNEKGTGEKGDLIFCPPGIPMKRQALSMLNFHFFQFELPQEEHLEAGKVSLKDLERVMSDYLYLKRYAFEQNEESKKIKEHLLLDLFHLYAIEGERAFFELESMRHQDQLINKAVLYIRKHAFQPIQLNELAESLSLSSVQFTRRFTRSIGMAPSDYLTSIRIRQARQQLLETDKTIDVIAKECGFNNGFYLSRVFKKRMKMSPAHYRKTHWI